MNSNTLKNSLRTIFIVAIILSILLLIYNFDTLVQTENTSYVASSQVPQLIESTTVHNGSTTLISVITIFNNGTLPLNFFFGPSLVVFMGLHNITISNYTFESHFPKVIQPGKFAYAFLNITVNFTGKVSYFSKVDYYVGNWKPDPYQTDYEYVKFIAGVEFQWQG